MQPGMLAIRERFPGLPLDLADACVAEAAARLGTTLQPNPSNGPESQHRGSAGRTTWC